jgi:hypothetical protein
MTILHLIILTYGLCFLAADARIFGTDATGYVATLYGDVAPTDEERCELLTRGIVPLRQRILRVKFLREHLSCYFCMGVWAGPLAHYILMQVQQFGPPWQIQDYFLNHPDTGAGWAYGMGCAFLFGAVGSYCLNALISAVESH